ncbi:MAG TPA: hypothetical protein PL063_01360 [Candidatus Cloacimonadota bacterium]|nr:hypothetical protein [Candidatus Cloacimonadota bacterium]HQB40542.1 hypothetical protein [Candidatus Cloacimonadota bacterium]
MTYQKAVQDLKKIEENPIKTMYYNEVLLSWDKVLKSLNAEYNMENFEAMAKALSSHLQYLKNPKFLFKNKDFENGFQESDPVFSISYLHDIISYLLKPSGLLNEPSLELSLQPFNYNMHLKLSSFSNIVAHNQIEFESSDPVFSLCIKMFMQYKAVSKQGFKNDSFKYPLLVFMVFKRYGKKEYNQVDVTKQQLHKCNPNAYLVIIAESIDKNAANYILNKNTNVFILRSGHSYDNRHLQRVLYNFRARIYNYLNERQVDFSEFIKNGFYQENYTSSNKNYKRKKIY